MSFENQERYRRKPDLVHAVRLTAEGNVPITHADADWIRQTVADKRLAYAGERNGIAPTAGRNYSEGGWFANPGSLHVQAAYGGDWLVLHDATQAVEVLTDGAFRTRYEAIPFAEDE